MTGVRLRFLLVLVLVMCRVKGILRSTFESLEVEEGQSDYFIFLRIYLFNPGVAFSCRGVGGVLGLMRV